MSQAGRRVRVLAVVVGVALSAFSLGFSWAAVDDYAQREVLPRGSIVAGVDVGGLRRTDAVALVRERVEQPLLQPLAVTARAKRLALDPTPMLAVDVEGMVDRALAPQAGRPFAQRVYARVTGKAAAAPVPAEVRVDLEKLRQWTASAAKASYVRAIDSKLSVDGDRLRISKSQVGWKVDEKAGLAVLQAAIAGGTHAAELPMAAVKPRVTERSFGRTILVRLGERHLYLFNGERRVVDYPIAVGMPEFPTPQGWWRIVDKQVNPTWTNPHSGWSAGMPDSIPGGPGNPLGTRALLLDASGVAIHGTSADGSIGTAASHACMRMHMGDVEDLYPRVDVGDRVIVAP